jgi:arsenite-transporting ATPase
MVIKESQRNFTYLSLYDHSADAIVVNRVIPPEVEDPFLYSWRNLQSEHLQTVHDIFSPIPILEIPLFPAEVVGAPMLEHMADALFGDRDPTDFLHHGRAFHIEQTDDGCDLIIPAPAIDKADIDLIRNADEIVVRMGALKRHIVLPRSMMQFQHTSARLREDSLSIHFVRPARP